MKLKKQVAKLSKNKSEQLALDLGHLNSLNIENFIVSEANSLAFNHVTSFPNWRTPFSLILGPKKSGKSHLAHIWADISKAYFATNEKLEILAKEGGQHPVLLENIDSENFEENALFHFLNQSIRDARPVLMSAVKPISQWPYKKADILSRARLAASFEVAMPDDIQLSQMFAKLFSDRQIKVDPKIISYLVSRMQRSSEDVVILVALMDRIALSKNKAITKMVAQEALAIREETLNIRELAQNIRNKALN